LNPREVISHYLQKVQQHNADLFSFVRMHEQYVDKNLDMLLQRKLKAAPIGIKDNMMLQGEITSCGSKMLETYVAPYTATCVTLLEQSGALAVGKTNMDEFAMGSSTEHSYFGVTKNPYSKYRIP
jgi:aspartyl-tRNA(Asn)/glutamyl-tRNA(Gln) amidotransferase subunit A